MERYAMMHRHGDAPCGAIAFYLVRRPVTGDMGLSSDARDLQGNPIPACGMASCFSCGRIVLLNTADIVDVIQ